MSILPGIHAPKECLKVKTMKEHKKSLGKYSRCLKCLGKGHRANTCTINVHCKRCGGSHNPVLCDGGMGSVGWLVPWLAPCMLGSLGIVWRCSLHRLLFEKRVNVGFVCYLILEVANPLLPPVSRSALTLR